jgi:hypothetical protein
MIFEAFSARAAEVIWTVVPSENQMCTFCNTIDRICRVCTANCSSTAQTLGTHRVSRGARHSLGASSGRSFVGGIRWRDSGASPPSIDTNHAPVAEQRCTAFARSNSPRKHCDQPHSWRITSPILPCLSSRLGHRWFPLSVKERSCGASLRSDCRLIMRRPRTRRQTSANRYPTP